MSGVKGSGAVKQEVFPHAVESLAIFLFQFIPARVEVFKPGHERPVVIGADQGPVFHDKVFSTAAPICAMDGILPPGKRYFVMKGSAVVVVESSFPMVSKRKNIHKKILIVDLDQ